MRRVPDDSDDEFKQAIRDVVRGLRHWNELTALGISILFANGSVVIENEGRLVGTANPEDVAEGLLRYAHDEQMLQQWAMVLLGGSSFLDLNLEGEGYGEALLEGLWDASADGHLRQGALAAAKELRSDHG